VKVRKTFVDKLSPNRLLVWFLISSYCYYRLDDPIMRDKDFDYLTLRLKAAWSEVEHPHKHLVVEDNLNAATGFDIAYPTIVKHVAMGIIKSDEKFE